MEKKEGDYLMNLKNSLPFKNLSGIENVKNIESIENIENTEELLDKLIHLYMEKRQLFFIQMKKGILSKEKFRKDAEQYLENSLHIKENSVKQKVLSDFENYIFGYSKLASLIDDKEISDIRIVRYDNIRVKKNGVRKDSGISFRTPKEFQQFVNFVATKNGVSISNLNAIQRFTDMDSHPDFILRFTISMPLVNTYNEPYLCIRKVPRQFPEIPDLIRFKMLEKPIAELLIQRFRQGSTLICGGNSSGKTTLLNALKETLPDNMAVLVTQQADELTTKHHPDTMFLHSLPGTNESQVTYDLEDISIAGLTMDVDFFIIGEVKGAEAMYLLNAAYTGQICAATIHAPSAEKAPNKLVDYALNKSKYSRNELMKMMDCFQTLVFMKNYKVEQIFAVEGWDEDAKELRYRPLFLR